MSNHHLTRNPDNEPVCTCGFRPDLLDATAPVGRDWKAKGIILDHAASLNSQDALDGYEAGMDALAAPVTHTDRPTTPRSPDAPFKDTSETKYPRAGVRRLPSGKWLLSLWDGDQVLHVFDEPEFDDRMTAFDYGWMTIGACRQSGTNLNGWANA